jgi:serine O-acetyltransferase
MFEKLVRMNCNAKIKVVRKFAGNLLEKLYGCQINCADMDPGVRFAHHGRGCTIVAAKLCANVVIFQNVTIGSNMRYKKSTKQWENVGTPIIAENVVIADGAKILGPIVVGRDCVIGAGAIVTSDVPPGSVVVGVNRCLPKDPNYDLVFNSDMIEPEKIALANKALVEKFQKKLRDESTINRI